MPFFIENQLENTLIKVKEGLLEEVKNACSQITYLNKELDIKAHVVDRGHLVHFLMGKNAR